jgi:hypothetical protein
MLLPILFLNMKVPYHNAEAFKLSCLVISRSFQRTTIRQTFLQHLPTNKQNSME